MMKAILTLFAVYFLLPGIAFSMMSPENIAKLNLKAEIILVGKVKGTGRVLLAEKGKDARKGVCILQVIHVIKGHSQVKQEQEIHILYELPLEPGKGLTAQRTGSPQVKVETGDVVVVYLNPSRFPDFYRPIAQGASVVVIDNNHNAQMKNRSKKDK